MTKYEIQETSHPALMYSDCSSPYGYSSLWAPSPTGRTAKQAGVFYTEFQFEKPRWFRKPKLIYSWIGDDCWRVSDSEFIIFGERNVSS